MPKPRSESKSKPKSTKSALTEEQKQAQLQAKIEQYIEDWFQVNTLLKNQILQVSEYFLNKHKSVKKKYNEWLKNFQGPINCEGLTLTESDHIKQVLLQACIFHSISAHEAMCSQFGTKLECYNEHGHPIIQLTKRIVDNGRSVALFYGKFIDEKICPAWGDRRVVVKLYQRSKYNTAFEINNYRLLGDPSPSLGINCYFWNIPVLIMKPMEVLSQDDDEIEMGIQLLKQLPIIHNYNVHCDIKPQNIMWETNSKGERVYKFIDFGGFSKKPLDGGRFFRRSTWTRKWTDQRAGDSASPKTDLLELGHTLAAQKMARAEYKPDHKFRYPRHREFSGRLKSYMDYVEKIDEKATHHKMYGRHYLALIEILAGGKQEKVIGNIINDNNNVDDVGNLPSLSSMSMSIPMSTSHMVLQ